MREKEGHRERGGEREEKRAHNYFLNVMLILLFCINIGWGSLFLDT